MKQFNLAEWALKHKSIIYYFMAVLLTFGIFSFTHMGRMEDPDFTMRTMVVGVAWPGASPQEMSDQVTDKLEEKLRDLPGVDYTKSFTDGSKSVIYINLREDLPSDKIRPAWEEARNMINDEWKSLPARRSRTDHQRSGSTTYMALSMPSAVMSIRTKKNDNKQKT